MVDPWWSLLGAAIPAIIAGQALRMKKRRADEQRLKSARGREKSSDEIFVCERVCTSKRMLKKARVLPPGMFDVMTSRTYHPTMVEPPDSRASVSISGGL